MNERGFQATMRSAAATDTGRKRPHNEDSFYRNDELGFYVVADGVGGQSKGEVASREAVEQLHAWIQRSTPRLHELYQDSTELQGDASLQARAAIRGMLESGVQSSCYMVFSMAELDPDKRGMSTTVSAMLFGPHHCYTAHVGDSRVYRVRAGACLQITEDHSLVNYQLKRGLISPAQAETARGKNVITRAVGHRDHVEIDTIEMDIQPGDRFLLCTDGLHGYLRDLREVVDLIEDGSLEASTGAAVALANHRGGQDNITVIVAEVSQTPSQGG